MLAPTSERPKGYVRVSNYRVDMAPDIQPEDGEVVLPVDRRNPVLGNKHILRKKFDIGERDRVIGAFERDLDRDFSVRGPMYQAILVIAQRVIAGEQIVLQCACKPSRCHGDIIAQKVDTLVKRIQAGGLA